MGSESTATVPLGPVEPLLTCILTFLSTASMANRARAHPSPAFISAKPVIGKFRLWARSFDTEQCHLDKLLAEDAVLLETVILHFSGFIASAAEAFGFLCDTDTINDLKHALSNAYPKSSTKSKASDDCDSGSHTGSTEGERTALSGITTSSHTQELEFIVDSLFSLLPVLEKTAEKITARESRLAENPPDRLENYITIISARYPNAESWLVRLVAQGVLDCHHRLESFSRKEQIPKPVVVATPMDQPTRADSALGTSLRSKSAAHSTPNSSKTACTPTTIPDSIQSPVSYAASTSAQSKATTILGGMVAVTLPPRPKGGTCPICNERNAFGTNAEWSKHIFIDLEPYICLVHNCKVQSNPYKSQREWMEHERTSHGARSESQCPFGCCVDCMSGGSWYRHVGHHMKDIRLLALPPSVRQSYGDEDSDEVLFDSNSSIASSSGFAPGATIFPIREEQAESDPGKSLKHRLRSHEVVEKQQLVQEWVTDNRFGASTEEDPYQVLPLEGTASIFCCNPTSVTSHAAAPWYFNRQSTCPECNHSPCAKCTYEEYSTCNSSQCFVTTNHSHTYTDNNDNELNCPIIYGSVSFGDIINHSPQYGPPIDTPTHADMEDLVRTIGWDTFSRQLSVINQDKYRFTIPPFHRNEPENFWISKNIDFTQWELADDSRAMLLSAPPSHRTTEVCSHLIELAKEKASQTNSSVLYFFCSTVPEARRLPVFTHTILHQIVCSSNVEKADSITTAFLLTLLGRHFQQRTQVFKQDNHPDTTIQKILDAPGNLLIEALVEAVKTAGIQELSIFVDGMTEDIVRLIVKHSMRATRKLKALFTIDESPKYGNILDRMMCIEYDKERKECLRSLYYDDTRYDKISEEHHGSLGWLWRHPQYLQWSTSATSSLLYIEGKPGSGKSTLAKYFVKNLEKVPNASSSAVAHYFYTFRGTVLESTHENMLRSILRSILEQDESAFFHFQQKFRDFQHRNHSKWPYETLKQVLSSFANHSSTKPLYLILDAIDESVENDRRSIIQLICRLCSHENSCNIKVFLASRPVAELTYSMHGRYPMITLQDQNKDDIAKFADDFLKTDLLISGEVLRDARNYITENAQGVFVWVSLVRMELINRIEWGHPEGEFLECLKAIPQDLENIYKSIFHRMENRQSEIIQDGIRVFRFVLFALRPLTVVELRDSLAMPDDINPSLVRQQDIHAFKRRIQYCGDNFLEIKADETVQFMHQTAREFLIRTFPNASNLMFEISHKAHGVITTTWVKYLWLCFTGPRMRDNFSKIKSWSPSDFRAYAEYLNDWPLVGYILCYIKDHLDLCGPNKDVSDLLITLTTQLANNHASYFLGSFLNFRFGHNYGNAFPSNEYQETSENVQYSTLNAAAELKLHDVVQALLLTCTQDAPHAQQKTPLIISVQKGLIGATQLLLDQDLKKDTKDDFGRTALHYAAENGDETIVRLLVKKGANKTIIDNSKEIPLHLAVKRL